MKLTIEIARWRDIHHAEARGVNEGLVTADLLAIEAFFQGSHFGKQFALLKESIGLSWQATERKINTMSMNGSLTACR